MFLHLLGAVAGIGPTFAFARISAMGRTEPVHSTFAVSVVRSIQSRLTLPLATLTLATGLAMVAILGYDLTRTGWLSLSIALFTTSYLYSMLVQNGDLLRVIDLASRTAPLSPAETADLARRRWRLRAAGLYLRVGAVVILFLMVVKPF
jgi:hypothetical protein